jgi:hypothetical protein
MPKLAYADFVKVGYCGECEGLHVQLHDKTGRVFAVAVLDQQQAAEIGEECFAFCKDGAAARASVMTKRAGRLQ